MSHRTAACGTALERRERIIVEDTLQNPISIRTPALNVMFTLIRRSGTLLGMFRPRLNQPVNFRQREGAFRHGITSSREFPAASEAPEA